ncbi:hypothetical protein TEA_014275 [Camellia sinensis var. sinensis]|uniref:Major facilitator superfamily (MFS) profile domain-containing protein n=1 Tax=Camellia sinensis var. sinensis TaxID=542762 RepID=A0A4S4E7B2_CAMSN|nr:hypothetical protein TEA_014275 [Camellia sinensis var. sinensis]
MDGAILMGFATNYAFLMVGRFVAGIGVGYGLLIAPVYTAEVSTAASRGFLTSFPEVFINAAVGMMASSLWNRHPQLGFQYESSQFSIQSRAHSSNFRQYHSPSPSVVKNRRICRGHRNKIYCYNSNDTSNTRPERTGIQLYRDIESAAKSGRQQEKENKNIDQKQNLSFSHKIFAPLIMDENCGMAKKRSSVDGSRGSLNERAFPRICIWESKGEAGDITCDIIDNVEASMFYRDGTGFDCHGIRKFQRSPCCLNGEVKKPGQTISKGHKNYDLMLNLQLGIRLVTENVRQSQDAWGGSGDWSEVEGAWVLKPRNSKPTSVVHFVGGIFVGAAPQLTYRLFLERLSEKGILVIATPYASGFDHFFIADEVQFKFDRCLRFLQETVQDLPTFGIGHSLGSVIHLLIGSRYAVQRNGNVLMAFNNKVLDHYIMA